MKKSQYSIFLSNENMDTLIEHKTFLLRGDEYKHLAVVLRVKIGDNVDVLSENGIISSTTIVSINKKEILLKLLSFLQEVKPNYTIILALAMTKNLRRTWILEKSVELKTSEILFWKADHSQIYSQKENSFNDTFRQAAKQCRNPYLPFVSFADSITEVLEYIRTLDAIPFFFYEKSESSRKISLSQYKNSTKPIVLIIGPEGGFSQNEVNTLLENNVISYSLGSSILRYETAAFLALALFYSINESIAE